LTLKIEAGCSFQCWQLQKAAASQLIRLTDEHLRHFALLCGVQRFESVCGQLGNTIRMRNAVGRLRFLSTTRCNISAELEFIASHFYDFLRRPDALKTLPFSLIYAIICHESLRLESEDGFYDSINDGIETYREMFGLLEFVRLESYSPGVVNAFFDRLSEHFYEINGPMWLTICARLVLPNMGKKPRK
jgi:hypothetical protein